MRYGSVCSGIEAATVAWDSLGWTPQWFSEIEPFPSTVLAHHYPNVPNFGDMTKFKEWTLDDSTAIDVLVGGTPCQSFSVAGLRKGLEDPRGNLMLTYLAIARRYRPEWLVWENVPGVLSSANGRDFGSFLGGLAECGYGFAYRVLDAQYFGVAQRRKRVFVVGHFGDWRLAAAVLFESSSMRGDPPPRREARKGTTAGSLRSTDGGSDVDHARAEHLIPEIANPLTHRMHKGVNTTADEGQTMILEPLPFDETQMTHPANHTLRDGHSEGTPAAMTGMQVRRLTPRECERLQGFPDNYTNIPWRKKEESPDGPRYKALGNSMAVPVMHWIGKRIADAP